MSHKHTIQAILQSRHIKKSRSDDFNQSIAMSREILEMETQFKETSFYKIPAAKTAEITNGFNHHLVETYPLG